MSKQVVIQSPDGEIKFGTRADNSEEKGNSNFEENESNELLFDLENQDNLDSEELILTDEYEVRFKLLKRKSIIVQIICSVEIILQTSWFYGDDESHFEQNLLILSIILIGLISSYNLNKCGFLVYLVYQYLKTSLIFIFSVSIILLSIENSYQQYIIDYNQSILAMTSPYFILFCLLENMIQIYITFYLQLYYNLMIKTI